MDTQGGRSFRSDEDASTSDGRRSSVDSSKQSRGINHNRTHSEMDDGILSDDTVTSMTLLGGRETRRVHSRWKAQEDDFYARIIDAFGAWRKTRRKRWSAFGRFVMTVLREAARAKWTIKLQIISLISIFTLTLVFTIHIYHHSHFAPYPWRQHCATQAPFPMDKYREQEPVGVLVGVMSMAGDGAAKRRKQIRSTWASHWASRGRWQEGQVWNHTTPNMASSTNIMDPTSRVVVRFIVGWPKPEFRAALKEEMQKYNDIVIVPMRENMNEGKSFAFFDWSFKHALVPPPRNLTDSTGSSDLFTTHDGYPSYRNERVRDPHWHHEDNQAQPHGWAMFKSWESRPPAPHDPLGPDGKPYSDKEAWVRPDYILKADDDSFVMLAELEARLRVLPRKGVYWGYPVRAGNVDFHAGEAYALSWDLIGHVSTYAHRNRRRTFDASTTTAEPDNEADIAIPTEGAAKRHWGNGEYGKGEDRNGDSAAPWRGRRRQRFQNLALPIVGREDQVTAGWMKEHGEEWEVTWYDERCWIYDHPKSGTVYSKGFLFPWEISRIRGEWNSGLRAGLVDEARKTGQAKHKSRPEYKRLFDATYSTVLRAFYRYSYPFAPKWDTLYHSPLPTVSGSQRLRREMELDVLVEGSELSMFVAGQDDEKEIARRWREDMARGWRGRYLLDPAATGQATTELQVPIGGTVVVHFVKQAEYWRDCVDVLLEGWTHERTLMDDSLAFSMST